MCNCIECIGEMPEPYLVEHDFYPNFYAVFFKSERLTEWFIKSENAWESFDLKY